MRSVFTLFLEKRGEFECAEVWSWDYQGSMEWRGEKIWKDTEIEKLEGHSKNSYRYTVHQVVSTNCFFKKSQLRSYSLRMEKTEFDLSFISL